MSSPAAAAPGSLTGSLLRNPALGKAAAALALYEGGSQIYGKVKGVAEKHFTFTVSIEEGDSVYSDVHRWLLSILPEDRHRSLRVVTRRYYGGDSDLTVPSSEHDAEQRRIDVMFDDDEERPVTIDGHRVKVRVHHPEMAGSDKRRSYEPRTIKFTARTYAGQQAVVAHVRRLHREQKVERTPSLKMVTSWGSWRSRGDLPTRSLDSVILPERQKAEIVADLGAFLDAEERYNRLAIPWHRAYMFEGPPGTGKTSLVRALAGHFNLDLWYVSLGDLTDEASLMQLISEVSPRSVLLLEDIDTVKFTHEDGEADLGKSISVNSLLQALDGVPTPHGLITMMTTNHFDRLDERLVRAGRMDRIEKIGLPGPEEIARLYRHFYGRDLNEYALGLAKRAGQRSAAEISETFKRHLDDPDGAMRALTQIYERDTARR